MLRNCKRRRARSQRLCSNEASPVVELGTTRLRDTTIDLKVTLSTRSQSSGEVVNLLAHPTSEYLNGPSLLPALERGKQRRRAAGAATSILHDVCSQSNRKDCAVRRKNRKNQRETPLTCSRSLYRRSLKLALDWAVQRNLWRGQAVYIRSLFDANKNIRDPRQQRVWKRFLCGWNYL